MWKLFILQQTFIANIQIIYETDHFYKNLTCCLVLTRSRGWKRTVEQVPLKMFPITISKGWQADDLIVLSSYRLIVLLSYRLIVLVSISTWVTLPGRPLSLGSAGTPPPSWSPVSSCPFYCISSVFSSVFLLGSRLVLFRYNSAMLVKALARPRFSVFKGFLVRPRVQVRQVGRSVLPGGPAAVKVLWSLHLKHWTSEENTTTR